MAEYTLPSSRLTNWEPNVRVGVIGGILTTRTSSIDVTQAPYNADNTGATDASAAIQAALNAATAEQIVYLPAGEYLVNTTLSMNKVAKTLRGAGVDETVIKVTGQLSYAISIGDGYSMAGHTAWPTAGVTITSGVSAGSTLLTVSSTSDITVGNLVHLQFEEQQDNAAIQAGAIPTISVTGFNYVGAQSVLTQNVRVTAKTANTITIFPPIIRDHNPTAAKLWVGQWVNGNIGVESLTIDGTLSTGELLQTGIRFGQCYNSWAKDVKIVKPRNYGIAFEGCCNCEMRRCEVTVRNGNGTNGAGILLNNTTCTLVEDNIIFDIFPSIEVNFGTCGCVVAYNIFENPPRLIDETLYLLDTINTNHGPHNYLNLYEGNIAANIKSDGYFGGASQDTFFRNWLHGSYEDHDMWTYVTALNRFTRDYSLVGNLLMRGDHSSNDPYSFGNPNIGNAFYSGSASPLNGDFWTDWKATGTITALTSSLSAGELTVSAGHIYDEASVSFPHYITIRQLDGSSAALLEAYAQVGNVVTFHNSSVTLLSSVGTEVEVWWGNQGFQELDLDVRATTVLKANYNVKTGSIPASESLGGDTLANSWFRSSKPSYFGDLDWPPFDPLDPNPSFTAIPAGYRFITGTEVGGGGATTPPPTTPAPTTPAPTTAPGTTPPPTIVRAWFLITPFY